MFIYCNVGSEETGVQLD